MDCAINGFSLICLTSQQYKHQDSRVPTKTMVHGNPIHKTAPTNHSLETRPFVYERRSSSLESRPLV